jgi:acetolactate synthase-1/2/3 large subunit
MTGGQIVAEYLVREGMPYLFGVPGHGNTALLDAFVDRRDEIKLVQAIHEQGAAHMADAFYRVARKVCGVFTSIGPGAANTAMGVANAYIDSIPLLLLTGSVHTYMRGRGVLQELERTHWANFPRMMEPVVKRWWQPSRVDQLANVLHLAFNVMLEGRRGPAYIDLPMDIQAEDAEIASLPEPVTRRPHGRAHGDPQMVDRVAQTLLKAERPMIVIGGGVVASQAERELQAVAEFIGCPMTVTWMGKGAIAEDHPLYAWPCGDLGSISGNTLTREADVILAVGCRFTDRTSSSFRRGVTFNIPPTKLLQIDLDPYEIGKNYPVEVGLVGDAKATLEDLLRCLTGLSKPRDYANSAYFARIQKLKAEWQEALRPSRESTNTPMTISRAIGAKFAAPDRQVVAIVGDGSFLQTIEELAMAAQYDIPAIFLVMNNFGWECIKNLQTTQFGPDRAIATKFGKPDGTPFSANLAAIAQGFGCHGERVENPNEVGPALRRAIASGRPAVVEALCSRELPGSALTTTGWWDVTVPTYHKKKRAAYEAARSEESLT